LNTKKI